LRRDPLHTHSARSKVAANAIKKQLAFSKEKKGGVALGAGSGRREGRGTQNGKEPPVRASKGR